MTMKQEDMQIQSNVVSPAMGLNDNLNFCGRILHIQTENVKSSTPCILTHVFSQGRVIYTARHEYSNDDHKSDNWVEIRKLMHKQHVGVIEKISKQQAKYQEQS